MADDKNFKALIAEQKKSNIALNKIAGIEEQQAQKKERSAEEIKADASRSQKMTEKHQAKIEKSVKKDAPDGTGTPPPSSEEEGEKDRTKALANAIGKPLGKFGKGIMDGFKKLGGFFKDKAKGAISVLGNLLKFGIMGAALFAITTFLKSETWAEWKDKLVPALVSAFDSVTEVLKWAKDKIVNGMAAFKTLFTTGFFDKDGNFIGIGASFTLLKDAFLGVGTFIVGLGLLLSPVKLGKVAINLAISGLKLAFTGAMGLTKFLGTMAGKILSLAATGAKGAGQLILNGIKAVGRALTALKVFMMSTVAPAIMNLVATGAKGAGGAIMGAVGKVGKALTALRVFMMASLLPAITGMLAGFAPLLVPLLIVVAVIAAAALVIASIKNAIDDFRCTLEETGSIFTALKVGFASLIANVLGIIPNLIKDFVAWIFCKLGWTEWAAKLKEIDVVSFIKTGLINIFTKFGAWIGKIYDDYIKPLLAPLLKFFDPAINIIKKVFNFLMDAIQPVIDFIAKIAKKIGGFIKKIASKLNPLTWFGGGDKDKVEDLDGVVDNTTKANIEIESIPEVEKEMITTLPRATVTAANAFPMEGPPVNGGSTNTILNAPTSSVQTTNTNIVRNVVEPDVYFRRQAGFAL
jgi:ribosomal protein S13